LLLRGYVRSRSSSGCAAVSSTSSTLPASIKQTHATLVARIRAELGIEIPLGAIFNAPTIAALTDWLTEEGASESADPFAVVLSIRRAGTKPPMWCVHPGSGLSWGLRGLIAHLHDWPIYGLQARGINGTTPLAISMTAMVNDYLEQILTIQNAGPFFLLGFSFGCVVAHGVAAELQRRGHEVGLLALIASVPAWGDDALMMRELPPENEHLSALRTWTKERYDISSDDDPDYEQLAKTSVAIIKNIVNVWKEYVPPVYDGPSALFIPTIDEGRSKVQCIAEWTPYLKGTVSVHDVQGAHLDMDLPAPMSMIGQTLDHALQQPRK
jgi:thioesterase domain-containing protein